MGAQFGITGEELEKLVKLDPNDFPRRKWLALAYARQTAALRGAEPQGPEADEFRAAYSKKEQAHIKKILRMMKAANYTSNTLLHMPWRRELSGPETPAQKDGIVATGLALASDMAFAARKRLGI
ncbi:MAG: hypothetical protein AB1921_20125 [Thermodesulfobacteriota bacterium]